MPFALEHHTRDSAPESKNGSSSGCGGSLGYACDASDTNNETAEVTKEESEQQSGDKQSSEEAQVRTKVESTCSNRMASVVMPEPSIWTNLLNFLQALFFWSARPDKLSKHST
jgi:hypothetical protein